MIIRNFQSLCYFLLFAVPVSLAADAPVTCGPGSKCPSDKPCCSQYGQCGVGAYCLGGCDPQFSNKIESCVPGPVCVSKDYKLNSMDRITPKSKYLGDSSKTDWVSDGTPLAFNDQVVLTMAQDTVGTLLASSTYVWYGKISATMKTSRGAGVVTAFILLSDVKDEIDYEFVGVDLSDAQTNYYYQGITDYTHGGNISLSDTFNNYHTYTIDWTPDQITWSVDGQVGRTKKKADTFNTTANRYDYPQTPARIQLSIWPGGLPSNGKGTIDWAGGPITYTGPDVSANGYYYAMVNEVKVECYDPPSGAKKSGGKSYVYTKDSGTEADVAISDNPTVLKSLLGTGTDMQADYPSSAAGSDTAAVIPGLSGAGPGTDGQRGQDDKGSSSSGSSNSGGSSASGAPVGSSGSGTGSGTGSGSASTATGFSQGAPANAVSGKSGAGASMGKGGRSGLVVGSGVATVMACFAIALL